MPLDEDFELVRAESITIISLLIKSSPITEGFESRVAYSRATIMPPLGLPRDRGFCTLQGMRV